VECMDTPQAIETCCASINLTLTNVMATCPLLKSVPWDIPLEVEIKVGKCWGDKDATVWRKSS